MSTVPTVLYLQEKMSQVESCLQPDNTGNTTNNHTKNATHNTSLTKLNILFVGTGPPTYDLPPVMDYANLKEMEKALPRALYCHLLRHNLITIEEEYVEVWMSDIPQKWWPSFIRNQDEIEMHDLDHYQSLIARHIQRLYPRCSAIVYDCCDHYIYLPKHVPNALEVARAIQDQLFATRFGITRTFRHHYKMKFQEFVATGTDDKPVYDLIWFFGCCSPHYLFDVSPDFIDNFRNRLIPHGLILYSDPIHTPDDKRVLSETLVESNLVTTAGTTTTTSDEKRKNATEFALPVHDLIDILERFQRFDWCDHSKEDNEDDGQDQLEDRTKVEFMLSHLDTVALGIYQFKTNSRKPKVDSYQPQ